MSAPAPRIALAALLVLGLLAAPPAPPAVAQTQQTQHRTSDGNRTLDVRARGEVEFTDDDRDVRRISPGGSLLVEEQRRGGPTRRVEFTPGEGGGVRRSYRVNGESRALDPAARAWLARILPETIRESGVGARQRVARILARRGVSGVQEEISRIRSDGARKTYFAALLDHPSLRPDDVAGVLRQAGRDIGSDGDKSSVLIRAAGRYPLSAPATRAAFFETVGTIGSDGDHARVLREVLGSGTLTRDVAVAALRSARSIGSDGDKTAVLLHLPAARLDDRAVAAAYLETAESIGSDGDRARALAFLHRAGRGR